MKLSIPRIKVQMAKKLMNGPDLAYESGLSVNSVSDYLAGRRHPSLKSIGKIALALDCDVLDIVEEVQNEE